MSELDQNLLDITNKFIIAYKTCKNPNKSNIFSYIKEKILNKKIIKVYTDGSCLNNGKPNSKAGYGIYFGENDKRNRSKRVIGKQSNNTAELTAIIEVYKLLEKEINNNVKIIIYTDSSYSIKCVTSYGSKCFVNNWKKDIPNKELVRKAYELFMDKKNVEFKYIKAHTNKNDEHSKGNEKADLLAKKAIGIK